jgi:hypothetical protein
MYHDFSVGMANKAQELWALLVMLNPTGKCHLIFELVFLLTNVSLFFSGHGQQGYLGMMPVGNTGYVQPNR